MTVKKGRSSKADRTATLQTGMPAPDFNLASHQGTHWQLSERRGSQNVVVVFYPFAFTGT